MTYDCERCHWDKQKAQHFKDCPCKCHETVQALPEIPRCEKCSWPLAASVEEGCVPGNCSMRPVPKKHVEDSVKFWSDKYEAKVEELHEMWKEARSFEGSFNSASKSIANQMEIIDRLTNETFELKKEIAHLKESRSKWAKQSSLNADLYEESIRPSQAPEVKKPKDIRLPQKLNQRLHGELCEIMPSVCDDSGQAEWSVGELQVLIDKFWEIVLPEISPAPAGGEYEAYYQLANIASAFVNLKPEHPLYESIRQDLKRVLDQLKGGAHE